MWVGIEYVLTALFFTLPISGIFYWYWFSTSYDFDNRYYQIVITNWRGQKESIHIEYIDSLDLKPLLFASGHLNFKYHNKQYQIANIANARLWKQRLENRISEHDELMDQIQRNQHIWDGVVEYPPIPINLTSSKMRLQCHLK